MQQETTKFQDLDMVANSVLDENDRSIYIESIRCYQIGSHRAAVILVWSATAECLRRRINELAAEGDSFAQESAIELNKVDGQAVYEENLIANAKKCELIDDFDEKSLKYVRDMRSKCAHPTGFVPSAEAVRHVLYICSHTVLCQRGYRGISFLKNVVTIQFDDQHFLPDESKVRDHCIAIIRKVPKRLWPQFTSIAAIERPKSPPEIWRNNAIKFFRVLLVESDDGTARQIAAGMQGFEAGAVDFFPILVGLDPRVNKFWDEQKRAQARSRLRSTTAIKVTKDEVSAWATLCAADGLDEEDKALIRQQLHAISRFLIFEQNFLEQRRNDLCDLLIEMLFDDNLSNKAALACRSLFSSSSLFDEANDKSYTIVEEVIRRYSDEEKYREIFDIVPKWADALLEQLLILSEDYLLECSEDHPENVNIIVDAAREYARRTPPHIPVEFTSASNRVLHGELCPEWSSKASVLGTTFRSQLSLLLDRYSDVFPEIDRALLTLPSETEEVNEEL